MSLKKEEERKRYLQSLFCNVIRPRDIVIRANCNPKRANFCNGPCNRRNCNESPRATCTGPCNVVGQICNPRNIM